MRFLALLQVILGLPEPLSVHVHRLAWRDLLGQSLGVWEQRGVQQLAEVLRGGGLAVQDEGATAARNNELGDLLPVLGAVCLRE